MDLRIDDAIELRIMNWARTTQIKKSKHTNFVSPVTILVIFRNKFGGFMSSFKMLDSVASGNPLSSISSKSFV